MTTTGTPAFAFVTDDDQPDVGFPIHARRTLILTAVMLALSFLPAPWSAAALPFALVVPGYGLCSALVGPRRPHGIGVRVVLWVAVSTAAFILAGVVVGAIGFELDRTRVLLGQAGLAVLAAGIAVVRRSTTDPSADVLPTTDQRTEVVDDAVDLTERPDDPHQTRVAVGFLVATIAIAAIGITLVQHNDDGAARITYVSMGFDGIVESAPLTVDSNGAATVTVVVHNHDLVPRDLTIEAGIDGGPAWDGTKPVTVDPDGRSTIRLVGPVPISGCYQRISVTLMDGDRPVTRLSRWVAGDPAMPCPVPATTG